MIEYESASPMTGPRPGTDRRWALIFALLVMSLTTLPYILGYLAQGNELYFTGFVFAVDDGNSYIAKMLSGSQGAWLFRTPYSTIPQGGLLILLPYMLLGKLAAPPAIHEQLVAIYHLFRFAAGIAAILATNDFLAFYNLSIPLRRWALAAAVLGGGLGWLLLLAGRDQLWGSLPLEFYSPETFGFLSLYGLPHLALARALILWALLCYLRMLQAGKSPTVQQMVGLSALWLCAAVVQPLAAGILGVVIGLHLMALLFLAGWYAWRGATPAFSTEIAWRSSLRIALLAGWPTGLFLTYNLWAVSQDAYLSNWAAQNRILAPHPGHYLLAYGLLLPFAWLGARCLWRQAPVTSLLPIAWVLALPILAYAPINLQRRMPDGLWVALVLLATAGIAGLQESRRGWRRHVSLLPLWLTLPGSLILVAGGCLAVQGAGLPIFRPVSEVNAFNFLASQAPPGSVVLSNYTTGNALPAWTPLRVVFGHGPETADFNAVQAQVAAFYSPDTPDENRVALIQAQGVDYIWWGPAEKVMGSETAPLTGCLAETNLSAANCPIRLKMIYDQGDIQIYEVLP